MNEVVFKISGAIFVSDEAIEYYKGDGEIDLMGIVLDNVIIEGCGELTVTDAYFG